MKDAKFQSSVLRRTLRMIGTSRKITRNNATGARNRVPTICDWRGPRRGAPVSPVPPSEVVVGFLRSWVTGLADRGLGGGERVLGCLGLRQGLLHGGPQSTGHVR